MSKRMISYTSIVNQLASSSMKKITKDNHSNPYSQSSSTSSLPVFLFKFNIKTLEISHIVFSNSLCISIKFLNYPVITLPINNEHHHKRIIEVNKSSSLYFKSTATDLEEKLKKTPLVIVLLDKVSQQIIASARIHLSVFGKEAYLAYNPSNRIPNQRRKTILLFHLSDLNKPIGGIDISMVIRREYFKEERINDTNDPNYNNRSDKETNISIANPDIIVPTLMTNLTNHPLNSQGYKSEVSFDYLRKRGFDSERDAPFEDGIKTNKDNQLGIFTGAKFPNPNAIFFSQKVTKPSSLPNEEKLSSIETISDVTNTKDKQKDNDKVMMIKTQKNKFIELHKNQQRKERTNDIIVNYDHFIRESFLSSLNNTTKSFMKIKESFVKTKENERNKKHKGLSKTKSCDNIDYYKKGTETSMNKNILIEQY